ncbi:GAS2-like protein 2 [Electrophorus electricus]|uniref:GAS2-like protein 2 n=1 Tax=Electrophorus electricus TaxID=8005 RepID=UPI0015D00C24|nr:GAS2-like protein 2 [Electrophorus electricus]
MSGIKHASNQSIRPFGSSEEYLYAMKEDLAEWLNDLYGVGLDVDNIMDVLGTGVLLCAHANNVTRVAEDFVGKHTGATQVRVPASGVTFVSSAQPATFLARDNVSNFINWCRNQMNIKDVLMFETDDLVLRKNEKNFVLCLLEVARRASRFGMAAPVLIQLEREIDDEMREETDLDAREPAQLAPQRRLLNTQNLDEMVQYLLCRCTCPTQFPMVKISDGKYRVGDSNTLIFVRILRTHVMVRVGGGWDTLEHYLDKHDPCRCTSLAHKLAHRPTTPIHEIKIRPSGPDSHIPLVLSRTQSPQELVIQASSALCRTQSAMPSPRLSRSPDLGPRNTLSPNKLRERAFRLTCSQSQDDSALKSISRRGREATRAFPTPRLTSSLPRPARPSTPARPERSVMPLVFQKAHSQTSLQGQQSTDNRLAQTWTKSQFVSKLRQNATTGAKNSQEMQGGPEKPACSVWARPLQCITPVQSVGLNANRISSVNRQPPNIGFQESESSGNASKSPDFNGTFCHFNGHELMGVISGNAHTRCPAATEKGQPAGSTHHYAHITSAVDGNERNLQRSSSNSNRKKYLCLPVHTVPNSPIHVGKPNSTVTAFQPSWGVSEVDGRDREGQLKRSYLFTPPPISPAQEAVLYQSLEEEILTNLQQLSTDSDDSDSENGQYSSGPETNEIQKPDHMSSTTNQRLCPSASFRPEKAQKSKSQAFTTECSNGKMQYEMVFTESWVNTLSRGLSARKQENHANADSNHLSLSHLSKVSSYSSIMGSKESPEPSKVSEANRVLGMGLIQGATLHSGTDMPGKAQAFVYSQKRSLKKPERVPSIYKLNLRPCIRPRRDHRSDKKPTRIPKPVFYKTHQCSGEAIQTKNTADSTAMSDIQKELDSPHGTCTRNNHQTAPRFTPTSSYTIECRGTGQEPVTVQDRESWV